MIDMVDKVGSTAFAVLELCNLRCNTFTQGVPKTLNVKQAPFLIEGGKPKTITLSLDKVLLDLCMRRPDEQVVKNGQQGHGHARFRVLASINQAVGANPLLSGTELTSN